MKKFEVCEKAKYSAYDCSIQITCFICSNKCRISYIYSYKTWLTTSVNNICFHDKKTVRRILLPLQNVYLLSGLEGLKNFIEELNSEI